MARVERDVAGCSEIVAIAKRKTTLVACYDDVMLMRGS